LFTLPVNFEDRRQ